VLRKSSFEAPSTTPLIQESGECSTSTTTEDRSCALRQARCTKDFYKSSDLSKSQLCRPSNSGRGVVSEMKTTGCIPQTTPPSTKDSSLVFGGNSKKRPQELGNLFFLFLFRLHEGLRSEPRGGKTLYPAGGEGL